MELIHDPSRLASIASSSTELRGTSGTRSGKNRYADSTVPLIPTHKFWVWNSERTRISGRMWLPSKLSKSSNHRMQFNQAAPEVPSFAVKTSSTAWNGWDFRFSNDSQRA